MAKMKTILFIPLCLLMFTCSDGPVVHKEVQWSQYVKIVRAIAENADLKECSYSKERINQFLIRNKPAWLRSAKPAEVDAVQVKEAILGDPKLKQILVIEFRGDPAHRYILFADGGIQWVPQHSAQESITPESRSAQQSIAPKSPSTHSAQESIPPESPSTPAKADENPPQ